MLPRLEFSHRAWRWGVFWVLAINLLGLHFALRPEPMWTGKENHDTRIMLKHIRLESNPIRWLWSDWPLNNGFYRPLPTYAFVADIRLWGADLAKYKLLSWLIATCAAFALAWFLFELTRSHAYAVAGAGLFSLWQTDLLLWLPLYEIALLASVGITIVGFRRWRGRWREWLPLAGAVVMLSTELPTPPIEWDLSTRSFGYRNMGWPPGRTATMFTLAALLCLAAYLRWDRERQGRWLVGCLLTLIAAAMCYEQVVVLPALLVAAALWRTLTTMTPTPRLPWVGMTHQRGTSDEGRRSWTSVVRRWAPVVIATFAVAAYWTWHSAAIPMTTDYQARHGRSLTGGVLALLHWAFPEMNSARLLIDMIDPEISFWALTFPSVWVALWMVGANLFALRAAMTYARTSAFGLGASLVAFSPMAFQIPLGHYYYLPSAFRTLYVIALAVAAWRLAKGLWQTPTSEPAHESPEATTERPESTGIRV